MIKEKIEIVQKSIEEACNKSGRDKKDVTLIAVSKTHPVEAIEEAYQNGCRDFGENKVQELVDKYEQLPKDIRWHLIGHLQTNKVKYIIDKVYLIHSVDSLHLAETINTEAIKHNRIVNILIEVNIAKEESKFGVFAEDAKELIKEISKLSNVKVCGLMTIAPYVDNSDENRQYFVNLKELFIDIARENIDNVTMNILSMGMSGDYEIAVEEGATYIRVGTFIFGERDYSKKIVG